MEDKPNAEDRLSIDEITGLINILELRVKDYCQANSIEYTHTSVDNVKELLARGLPDDIQRDIVQLLFLYGLSDNIPEGSVIN